MSEGYKREPEFSIDKSKLPPGTQIETHSDGALKGIRLADGSFVSVEELKKLADAKQTADNLHAQELADAIKRGGEVDVSSLDFSGLRDKPLGDENIVYDFQKVPVILGHKGFPEPVDLTEEIFPYLKNLKTNPLNSDIPPDFSK